MSGTLDLSDKTLEEYEGKIVEMDPRELPTAFRNLATGAGIFHDKSDRLKGKPTVTIEHRRSEDAWEEPMGIKDSTGRPLIVMDAEVEERELGRGLTEAEPGRGLRLRRAQR
jgi:hypothetical protein